MKIGKNSTFQRFFVTYLKKSKEQRRRLLVFSFFLLISVVIWFINALSKEYETEIRYPVSYSQNPKQKILVSDLPDYLELKVSAHGFELLGYKLFNRPEPIDFAISSYALNRSVSDSSRYYLLTKYAREKIAYQLRGRLNLIDISPDTLIFNFAREIRKKLPVRPNLDYQIGKEFIIKDKLKIDPDSIYVVGPDIWLDTTTFIKTKKINLGLLEKSYSGILELQRFKKFHYETEKVRCLIDIEKLTEVQIKVPIQVVGVPESYKMQAFPQEVRISGQVGLSNYDRIVPEAFWIEVNYKDVKDNRTRLPVVVIKYPDELIGIEVYPQSVEYILTVR